LTDIRDVLIKCKCKKIAGNQNQSYRSVMKTLLPKGQTWGRSKPVRCHERFLSLAQIDKLYHVLKWNMFVKETEIRMWPTMWLPKPVVPNRGAEAP